MKVLRIHHVSFIVSDLQKSLQFYCEVLGFPLSYDRPPMNFDGAWLTVGDSGQQIHLLQLDNPDPTEGRPEHGGRDRHAAFQVNDLETLIASLKQHQIGYTTSSSGRRALFIRDPDGNTLEFVQADL